MKQMTCRQLGGACDLVLEAETFSEMAELSKKHGSEMYQKQDPQHMEAMQKMQALMNDPEGMQNWFNSKQAEFDALPEI